jgi:hypothetical protein
MSSWLNMLFTEFSTFIFKNTIISGQLNITMHVSPIKYKDTSLTVLYSNYYLIFLTITVHLIYKQSIKKWKILKSNTVQRL